MNGCMAHPIRWKVAREEGGFCPYCELAEQRSKLHEADLTIAAKVKQGAALESRLDDHVKKGIEWVQQCERLDDENEQLRSRLDTLTTRLKEAEGLLGKWSLGLEYYDDRHSALELRVAEEASTAWLASIPRYVAAVEKHERICGVPDPDDECEECIRPLGHDGEHDFSTPPE